MEYDFDKVMPTNPTVEFFEDKKFEVIAMCMRLQPNIDGLSDEEANEIRFKSMDAVAEKHQFGKYRNLCETCDKDFATCDGDPMFGESEKNDNVCFCLQYSGELSTETVSKGLGEME